MLSVQSSHNVGSRACGGEWPSIGRNQRARWAALELWQHQGLASGWGGLGAPQVGRSRHWLKLDEAGASASPHIQITGTLSSMGLVSSDPPSLPSPLSSSSSSSPSSMSNSLPASEGVYVDPLGEVGNWF